MKTRKIFVGTALFAVISIAAGIAAMYKGLEHPDSGQTIFLGMTCFFSLIIAFIGIDYLISKK